MIRPQSRTDDNRSAILAQLGAHGPASRPDLARALNISPALVTQLAKDLLFEGLLREPDHTPSLVGRPANQLGLVSTAGRAWVSRSKPTMSRLMTSGLLSVRLTRLVSPGIQDVVLIGPREQ